MPAHFAKPAAKSFPGWAKPPPVMPPQRIAVALPDAEGNVLTGNQSLMWMQSEPLYAMPTPAIPSVLSAEAPSHPIIEPDQFDIPRPTYQRDLRTVDPNFAAATQESDRVLREMREAGRAAREAREQRQPPQAQLPPLQPDPMDPFATIQHGTSKGQPSPSPSPSQLSKGGPRYGDASSWSAWNRWHGSWEDRWSTSKGKSKGFSSHSWEISTSSPALQHQEWTRLLRQWGIDNQAKDLFWNLALTPGCEREAAGIIDEFLRQIRDIENRSGWLQRAVNNAVRDFRHGEKEEKELRRNRGRSGDSKS